MATDASGRQVKLLKLRASQLVKAENGHELCQEQIQLSINYLYWFGYLAWVVAKNVSYDDVLKAIEKFKKWFGIKGEKGLGPKTLKAMTYPRCGCPDIVDEENHRHKQFMRLQSASKEQMPKWTKCGLTYYIESYVSAKDLSKTAQDQIIAQAWKEWCNVCGLRVERAKTAKKADIIIGGGKGKDQDFDGPAGILAWAYMPDGEDTQLTMRFDLDETWISDKRDRGVLMLNVAGHEFGHLLGLTHSKRMQALMAPFYNESVATPQPDDDITRIQALYGPATGKQAITEPSGKKFVLHCSDLEIEGHMLVPIHLPN